MFNTLKYAKMLEEAGFSRKQAETSTKILVEIMEDKFATKYDLREFQLLVKQDLESFKTEWKHDLQEFKTEWKHDLQEFKNDSRYELKEMEHRLTLRMGSMFVAFTAILTALHKFL